MRNRFERGYALLSVIFLAAVMAIAAGVAVPRILQQGQREKELETIWRGKQYARAVKLFYRKNGRFPHSLDELTTPVNNVRVLRQPYKDPFNEDDGTWRLIYVGPMGQLIGSVKTPTQGQGLTIQLPGAPPGGVGTATGAAAATGQPGGMAGQPPAQGGTGLQPATPVLNVPGSGIGAPLAGPVGQTIGGNVIGVGSKVNRPSIIVYDGGATYKEWEFIWNPAKDPITIGGAPGAPIGTPIPSGIPGSTPPGGMPPPPPPPPRPPQD